MDLVCCPNYGFMTRCDRQCKLGRWL